MIARLRRLVLAALEHHRRRTGAFQRPDYMDRLRAVYKVKA